MSLAQNNFFFIINTGKFLIEIYLTYSTLGKFKVYNTLIGYICKL